MGKKRKVINPQHLDQFQNEMPPENFYELIESFIRNSDKNHKDIENRVRKRFWEEIYPICCLVNHLIQNNIFMESICAVQYTGNQSSAFDGYITLESKKKLSIDVTCDSNEHAALIIEHIQNHGYAYPLEPIKKKSTRAANKNEGPRICKQKELIARSSEEIAEHIKEHTKIIKKSLTNKSQKNVLPNIILINYTFSRDIHDPQIILFTSEITNHLNEIGWPFEKIFVIYYRGNNPQIIGMLPSITGPSSHF